MDIQDRARGGLLGMAVGEAMGAPLEGLTADEIEEKTGDRIEPYLDPHKFQPEHRAGFFVRGVYEDETQAALATVEALIRPGGFKVDDFRARLQELGKPITGNSFGCFRRARRNFRTAVRRMTAGAPWKECGINTAGSGAASRGIPIGIALYDGEEAMLRAAIEASLLTHRDPRACAATCAVAGLVAVLLTRKDALDPEATGKRVAELARRGEEIMGKEYSDVLYPGYEPYLHQFSTAADQLPALVQLDLEPAFAKIIEAASDKGSRPITSATRGFALTGVIASMYLFLTGLDNFEDTVLDTICEGGNTDTLGCLVGGFCGTYHGASNIPERWVKAMTNWPEVADRGMALVDSEVAAALGPLLLIEAQATPPQPEPLKKRRAQQQDRERRGPPNGPARGGRRGPPPRGGGRGGPPSRGGGGRGGPPPRRSGGGGGYGGRPRPGGDRDVARQGGGGRPYRGGGGRDGGRDAGGRDGGYRYPPRRDDRQGGRAPYRRDDRDGGGRPPRPGGSRYAGGRPGGGRPGPGGQGGRGRPDDRRGPPPPRRAPPREQEERPPRREREDGDE